MVLTEHDAFRDGYDGLEDRKRGTEGLLDEMRPQDHDAGPPRRRGAGGAGGGAHDTGRAMSKCLDDLLEAWEIHNEINLYILGWIPPEGLEAVTLLKTGKPSRGRNVSRIFAHMHEVRCSRLDSNFDAAGELPRFEGSESPDADRLGRALAHSGAAVASVVRSAVAADRPLKGWKRSPVAWLAYLLSHDSHHRGQIAQALKQSGVRPPQEVSYGIWGYWGGYPLKDPAG